MRLDQLELFRLGYEQDVGTHGKETAFTSLDHLKLEKEWYYA